MIGNLTRFQRDTLKEVGSIGANAASIALSKLTHKFILVDMKRFRIVSLEKTPAIFGSSKNNVVGVLFTFKGDIPGVMMSISSKKSVMLISDLIYGKKPGTTKHFDDHAEDLIKEVGNILVGSYLHALSDMTKLSMIESTPRLMIDKPSLVIREGLKALEGKVKDVVIIETVLSIGKRKRKRFKEEIRLLLTPKTLDTLFTHLFKDLR